MSNDQTKNTHSKRGIWYLAEVIYKRMVLFTTWEIMGFCFGFLLYLAIVYPHSDLQERIAEHDAMNDPLATEYIRAFLQAEPDNQQLRLMLARRLSKDANYFAEVRRLLGILYVQKDPDIRYQAHYMELLLREQELFALKKGDLNYPQVLERYRSQLLLVMSGAHHAEELIMLGKRAAAAGLYSTAVQIFRKLASLPHQTSQIYAEAADALRSFGEYAESANLYFRAMLTANSPNLKRRYFLLGMQTLQGGSLFKELAVAGNRYAGLFQEDIEVLMALTRMMQAADRIDLALPFVRQFMKMPNKGSVPGLPFNDEAYALAVQVFNWTDNVQDAIAVAEWAVKQQPKSVKWVDQLANLYAWNGRGAESIPYRLRYAHLTGKESAWDQVLELSGQVNDLKHMRIALEHKVDDIDTFIWLQDLLDLYERMGDPGAQISKLESLYRKARSPREREHYLWKEMGIFERREDIEHALEVAQRLEAEFGLTPEYGKKLASFYARRGNFDKSFELLGAIKKDVARLGEREKIFLRDPNTADARRAAAGLPFVEDVDFWRDYAEMGSVHQNTDAASEGLIGLLRGGSVRDQDLMNLFYIWTGQRQDAAAQLATFAFFNAEVETKTKIFMKSTALSRLDPKTGVGQVNEFPLTTMLAHKSFDSVFAVAAMDLYARLEDWVSARQFLEKMRVYPDELAASEIDMQAQNWPPSVVEYRRRNYERIRDRYFKSMAALEEDDRFLAPRATMWQRLGRSDLAQNDLMSALRHHPKNMHVRAALIWVLLERREAEVLKRVLAAWTHDAKTNEVLWQPFASALMSLNRPHEALYWLNKSRDKMKDDFLWQMSYADCLDGNSQPDIAWRIRRRAWLELRKPEVFQKLPESRFDELRNDLARLAQTFDTSDGAQRIIQRLLQADVKKLQLEVRPLEIPATGTAVIQAAAQADERMHARQEAKRVRRLEDLYRRGTGQRPHDDRYLEATVKELALAYAQNNDMHDLSRAWLATRFANHLARPLSEELALRMEENDRAAVLDMLDNLPDLLPMYDRVAAAEQVGSSALAQTLAHDQMVRLPDDEFLHEQFTNLTTQEHMGLTVKQVSRQQDALNTTETTVDAGVRVAPTLMVTPSVVLRQQSSQDLVNLPNVPVQDILAGLSLRKQTETGFVAATLHQRQAATTHQGGLLEYSGAWSRELLVNARAGWNQPATESALLQVGGMRSMLEANVTYQLTQREYARVDLGAERYSSQAGTFLGTGQFWNVEVGHHVRLEYPDIIARLYVSQATFQQSGLFDNQIARLIPLGSNPVGYAYLPQSSSAYGVSLGLGTTVEQRYTRAWRPFAEFGLSNNSLTGMGYDMRTGAAGSVLGSDVLKVYFQVLSNKPLSQQNSRELGFHYQWFF